MAVTDLRYHLSPHSLDAIGIGRRAEERRQPPRNLNFDATWAGDVAEHRDSLYQIPHRFRPVRVAGIYTFGQSVLKLPQLFGIAFEYCWMECQDVDRRRLGLEFSAEHFPFSVKHVHPCAEVIGVSNAPGDAVDQPANFATDLVKTSLEPNPLSAAKRFRSSWDDFTYSAITSGRRNT